MLREKTDPSWAVHLRKGSQDYKNVISIFILQLHQYSIQ